MVEKYFKPALSFAGRVGYSLFTAYQFLHEVSAFLDLTHTVTHTRKKADGVNGRESAKDHVLP
mgnify:FL=1